MRGNLLATISTVLTLSILIFSIIFYDANSLTLKCSIGIMGLCCCLLSMITNYFFTVDSIQYLVKRGQDEKALSAMIMLRSESVASVQTKTDFEALKQMIVQDSGKS